MGHEDVSKNDQEKDIESIGKISRPIESILSNTGLDKNRARQEIEKFLHKQNVPYTRIQILEDRDRSDNRDFLTVIISMPQTWPRDTGIPGTYTINISVPDTYQPEENSEI